MPANELIFRSATIEDLPDIVRMLAEDVLGATREQYEDPLPAPYIEAFNEIEADGNNHLIVAEQDGEVVGTMQLTFTPSISIRGGKRATIEAVRIDKGLRGQGAGKKMTLWAIERARAEGCIYVQLTTNAARADPHRFYHDLGFEASHIGMKIDLR